MEDLFGEDDNPYDEWVKRRRVEQESDEESVGNDIQEFFEKKAKEPPKKTQKKPPKELPYIVRTMSLAELKEMDHNSDITPLETEEDEEGEREDDDTYCFACDFADYSELDGEDVNTMLRMVDQGFMRYENKYLAADIHRFYMDHIYPTLRRTNRNAKKWTVNGIIDHIENHVKDPRFFIARMIMMYKSIMDFLMTKITQIVHIPATNSEIVVVNEKNVKLIMEIEKRSTELMGKKPQSMNFFNERCTLDFQNTGKFVNPNSFLAGRQK